MEHLPVQRLRPLGQGQMGRLPIQHLAELEQEQMKPLAAQVFSGLEQEQMKSLPTWNLLDFLGLEQESRLSQRPVPVQHLPTHTPQQSADRTLCLKQIEH